MYPRNTWFLKNNEFLSLCYAMTYELVFFCSLGNKGLARPFKYPYCDLRY